MYKNKEKQKEWYQKNKARRNEQSKKWNKEHREAKYNYELRAYGTTLEEYNKKLIAQNGLCAICGNTETRCIKGKISRLCQDHDHLSGKPREILCSACNSILGAAKDDIKNLEKAIQYLEKWKYLKS